MEISIELILGIIGSVTGVTSLLIQVLKYFNERPRIGAKLIASKHHYEKHGEPITNYWLGFLIDILVTNKGDRATTVGDAILYFKIGQKWIRITSDGLSERVDSSDMKTIRPSLSFTDSYERLGKQEKIPFKLILFHTHGKIKLEGISNIIPT